MESINPQTFTGQGATQGGGADPEGCAVISPLDSTRPCGCYIVAMPIHLMQQQLRFNRCTINNAKVDASDTYMPKR